MYNGTEMNALNFGIKRSRFKVTVELHMLEPSLYWRRHAVLDVSYRVKTF